MLKRKMDVSILSKDNIENLFKEADKTLNLSFEERRLFLNSPAIYYCMILPFACKQDFPEIKSLITLQNLISFNRNNMFFSHKENQLIEERIDLCLCESGGDRELVEGFKLYLSLCSLYDHYIDLDDDIKINKPNPLNCGFDYHKEKNKFLKQINELPNRVKFILDEIGIQRITEVGWLG